MRTPPFRKRLQEIVKYVFDGNVKAAAEAAGVEQPTLHRILAGSVREPRLSTLERLADRYGVPLDWILGRTDALPYDDEERGDPKAPRWWVLVARYHRRAQRDDHAFIQSLEGKARTENGKGIIREYWEMRRIDRTRIILDLAVQVDLDAKRPIDPGILPAYRAHWEMVTRTTALARRTLERLGEGA